MDKSIILLLTVFFAFSSSAVVYIKPTNDTQCTGEPCYTLSEYIPSLNPVVEPLYRAPYIKYVAIINYSLEIVFMEGMHSLDLVGPLYLESQGTAEYGLNFTGLLSSSPSEKLSIPEIQCNDLTGLRISSKAYAVFSNLAIVHCGVHNDRDIDLHLLSPDSKSAAALIFFQIVKLVLVNVSISHSNGYGLMSLYSENMIVQNCTFMKNCGSNNFPGGNVFIFMSDSRFLNETSLTIESTMIKDGHAVFSAYYSAGLCIILNPYLRDYKVQIIDTVMFNNSALRSYGGNFLILFYCSPDSILSVLPSTRIVLEHCTIQHGLGWTGGGTVKVYGNSASSSTLCGQVHFNVSSTIFSDNYGYLLYGGLQIELKNQQIYVDIHCTIFGSNIGNYGTIGIDIDSFHHLSISKYIHLDMQNCTIVNNTGKIGAGLKIEILYSGTTSDSYYTIGTSYASEIKVRGCLISHNTCEDYSGLSFHFYSNDVADQSHKLTVEDCTFSYNSVENVGTVSIFGNGREDLSVTFESVSFSYSDSRGNISTTSPSTVYLKKLENVSFINCIFDNNNIRGIFAYRSDIYFQGLVTFSNNTGLKGGAILLCSDSTLRPKLNTTVKFIANHALHTGGAINCEQKCSDYAHDIDCFLQPRVSYSELSSIRFIFSSNSAAYAGSALFGGSMNICSVWSTETKGTEVLHKIFKFENKTEDFNDLSPISSDPIGVCFCSQDRKRPNCKRKFQNIPIFPGTTFTVSLVTVGQHDGVVPGVAVASPSSVLDDLQDHQQTRNKCTNVQYTCTIFSSLPVMLTLTAKQPEPLDIKYTPPQINISLLDCPLGFELSEKNAHPKCDCIPLLESKEFQCDISTNKFLSPSTSVWIGSEHSKKNPSSIPHSIILLHPHCPLDYCINHKHFIDLTAPHQQCAFNRSGTLCGVCQPGLSMVLGSSLCRSCSNWWLFLFPVFVLAGIALIVLLIALNLTVSHGIINGVILYANILQANQAAFFPPNSNGFLSGFIAWMNLDLGIETCFYKGLDAYTKTWLQFVFPIYIWLLVVIIIIASRYSHTLAKLTGRNIVPVLATLFLLSYAKLIRTVISILLFALIECSDGRTKSVWYYDGNIEYLKGKHIPLFIVAILLLVIVSLPYTLILVFIQCLQAGSYHRVPLSWVHKMKPLFDAYTAPYKGKHRYWTGILLLVRVFLFLCFSLNQYGDPSVDLLVLTITIMCLIVYTHAVGGVYKSQLVDMLEQTFFLNLGITSAASLYVSEHRNILIDVSISFAFTVWIIILFYHVSIKISYLGTASTYFIAKINQLIKWPKYHFQKRKNAQEQSEQSQMAAINSVPSGVELREPLLEYTL